MYKYPMPKYLKNLFLFLLLVLVVSFFGATENTNRSPNEFVRLEQLSKTLIDKEATGRDSALSSGQLWSGWSRKEITPPPGTSTLGYGDRQAKGATDTDGPLFTTAFAFQIEDQSPLVMLTADICFWPNKLSQELSTRVSDILPRERIFFGATHTHDGPGSIIDAPLLEAVFGNYSTEVTERVLIGAEKAIRASLNNLEKSGFRTHEVHLPEFVKNRTQSNKHISDTAVVMELEKISGEKALIVTYSAHATIIAPHPIVSSANYPGMLNKTLESNGWQLSGFFAAETAQAGPSINGELVQAPGFKLAHKYGRLLADKIKSSIHNSTQKFETSVNITSIRSPYLLPDWGFRIPFFDRSLRSKLTTALLGGQEPEPHIHGLAINNLIFIGHGFELSSEHGLQARKSANKLGKILVPLSFNGEHHFYVVPESAYDELGYEPTMAFFGPHLAKYIDQLNSYMIEKLSGGY